MLNPLVKDLNKLVIGDTSNDMGLAFMACLHKDLLSSVKNFPPCNIIKLAEPVSYLVQVALAGYQKDELTVAIEGAELVITGAHKETEQPVDYLYNGIANRSFRRTFLLLGDLKVTDVKLQAGMLEVRLAGEPPKEAPKQKFDIC